jgi:hypothetical protein
MRRLAWVAGLLGLVAWLLRRRRGAHEAVADPRAAELRRKLDEAREAEPTIEDDLAVRRQHVHEQGRAALDEMRGDSA